MPRPALSKVSTAALQAEIERRVSKLADLLKLRDDVDRQLAELQSLAGQFGKAVAAPAPVAEPIHRRRMKAKVANVAAQPVKPAAKPAAAKQTATDFTLGLLAGGKTLTTAEIKAAWMDAGRGNRVDNALTALLKAGLVKREKIKGGMGSTFSLAAGRKAVAAKPPGKFTQTGNEFILGLLAGGKVLTSNELQAAWTKAGRKGKVAKTLGALVADKKLARRQLQGRKGFDYTLGGSAAPKAVVVAKPAAKKSKRTFTCRTCKKVFASGMMLGGHYKAQPTHRKA